MPVGWQGAAKADKVAQYNLGLCYMEGKGGIVDEQRGALPSFRILHSSVPLSHALCRQMVSARAALRLLCAAAASGHAEAMTRIGTHCEARGEERLAMRWFQKAAKLGHADALARLGQCYLHGRGTAADAALAVQASRSARARVRIDRSIGKSCES